MTNHYTTGNTTSPTRALILIHGRGASAESIMQLANELPLSNQYVLVAPQAANYSWYPERFIVPTSKNQPYLDTALQTIADIVHDLKATYDIAPEHITLTGFSQGACLASEFVKRNPTRYQGLAVLSGGLIGTDNEVSEPITGDLAGTPVYLGCDEQDFHIPAERVEQSADVFTSHGADVTMKLYHGLGHTVHPDGIQFLQNVLTEK